MSTARMSAPPEPFRTWWRGEANITVSRLPLPPLVQQGRLVTSATHRQRTEAAEPELTMQPLQRNVEVGDDGPSNVAAVYQWEGESHRGGQAGGLSQGTASHRLARPDIASPQPQSERRFSACRLAVNMSASWQLTHRGCGPRAARRPNGSAQSARGTLRGAAAFAGS